MSVGLENFFNHQQVSHRNSVVWIADDARNASEPRLHNPNLSAHAPAPPVSRVSQSTLPRFECQLALPTTQNQLLDDFSITESHFQETRRFRTSLHQEIQHSRFVHRMSKTCHREWVICRIRDVLPHRRLPVLRVTNRVCDRMPGTRIHPHQKFSDNDRNPVKLHFVLGRTRAQSRVPTGNANKG